MDAGSSVPRVTTAELATTDFDTQYFHANRPVIVTDAAAHWPARSRWSPQYLKDSLGSRAVVLKTNAQGVFDTNNYASTGKVEMFSSTLAQAVDLIVSAHGYRYYVHQRRLDADFPELVPDTQLPYLIDATKRQIITNIWFGGKGCKTPLHFDASENFLAQILGRKRVTFFAPACTPYLYAAVGDRRPHISRLNVFAPDLAKYPLFAHAQAMRVEFEIGPGEMLYIPKHWWHAVESLDVSISVNTWWMPLR